MRFSTLFVAVLLLNLISDYVDSVPVKGIDLNREPKPDSSDEKKEEHLPTKTQLPATFVIKKRKDRNDENSPSFKAKMIANMTQYPKKSKEWLKIYNSNYSKIRKEQGADFCKGMTEDPELSVKMHNQKQKTAVQRFYRGVQERRRTGLLTISDKKYYERQRRTSKEAYSENPELVKERVKKARLKIALQKQSAAETKQSNESHTKQ